MNLLEFINSENSETVRVPSGAVSRIIGTMGTTVPSSSLPISADQSSWITVGDPERLVRSFEFKRFEHLSYFVNELLAYQERVQHHALISINHLTVTIETYTHDIDAVTQQDKKLAYFCDEIFDDTRFFESDEQETI